MKHGWLIGLLVVMALAGCSGWTFGLERVKEEAVPQSLPGSATPIPPTPTHTAIEVPEEAAAAVQWAQGDLAKRLGVSVEEIKVVAVEYVKWNDASLGCPKPGMMYIQVITPGYRIVLENDGQRYEYHSAVGSDEAVFCERWGRALRSPPITRPPSGETR